MGIIKFVCELADLIPNATNREAILFIKDFPVEIGKVVSQRSAPGTVSSSLRRTPPKPVPAKEVVCSIGGTVATRTAREATRVCCTRVRSVPQTGTSLNGSGLFQFATRYRIAS